MCSNGKGMTGLTLFLISFSQLHQGVIIVDPPGPLYLPIFMQQNVSCSADGGGVLTRLTVIFNSGHAESSLARAGRVIVPGIEIIYSNIDITTILISVRTNNTSITALRCIGEVDSGSSITNVENTLNLTIYGVPDPPSIVSLSLEDNSLRSSWDYVRIPTVDVKLYWSLSFFRPSQLSNMTTALHNTNTYHYTLQGVRSCDPFSLCIRAENVVGNSYWSFINDILPYLPQRQDIEYSLVQVDETFSLNVTVVVPQECLSSMNSYRISVTSAEGNEVEVTIFPRVRSDGRSIHSLVENLMRNASYSFSIVSNNSIGQQSTAAIFFYTNNVEGVDICLLVDEQVYQISCRYVPGAVRTGCSYQLTGTNSTFISIDLIGEEYALHKSSDINCYNNIIIRNSDGYVIMSGPFITSSVMSCQATTTTAPTASTDSTKCSRNVSGLPIIITMGVIICIQCVMTPFITIFYKKFFINPFKQNGNKNSSTSQEDCSENPAYGVMPLSSSSSSQNRGKTNVLPEYEVVDLETKETSS